MLELDRRIDPHIDRARTKTTLTLPLEKRQRSRLRVTLDDGTEAGVLLSRGQTLRDGDLLGTEDGVVVEVRAAHERVSEVSCDDPLLLARACYHLGNRHVPLQIEAGRLRYLHDHVLDELARGLGLRPSSIEAPFEPEIGAYGGHIHGAGGHGH